MKLTRLIAIAAATPLLVSALSTELSSLEPWSVRSVHAEDADRGAKARPPLDESGGHRIKNPKGGVTWSFGRPPSAGAADAWKGVVKKNAAPSSQRLVLRRKDATSAPQGFSEYTPPGYPASAQWPLLITLHGIGENGDGNDDLHRVVENGIPKVIAEDRWHLDRPHVVLSPQHDSWGCPRPKSIKKFIEWAVEHYPVDPSRVYLAGSSCGANSIWSYLAEYGGKQVAAVVAVGGDGQAAWKKAGCKLGEVAIWGFHGHQDEVVDPVGTHVPLDGLSGCSSLPMGYRKTIYPERGHDSWYRTYGDMSGHDIYEWMLGYQKR